MRFLEFAVLFLPLHYHTSGSAVDVVVVASTTFKTGTISVDTPNPISFLESIHILANSGNYTSNLMANCNWIIIYTWNLSLVIINYLLGFRNIS